MSGRAPYWGKLWQWWGLMSLLLFPCTLMGLGRLYRHTVTGSVYEDCRATKYSRLWDCFCGADRTRWSMPLKDREQRLWQGVLIRARQKGFVFRDPEPRQTTPEADSFVRPVGHTIYGEAYMSGRILLSSQDMARMNDEEVDVLMGHELGHQVDAQTERTGYEIFNRFANADHETVAWAFVTELYGVEAIDRFRNKWQYTGFSDD